MMKWSIQAPEFGQRIEEYTHDLQPNTPWNLTTMPRNKNHYLTNFNPRIYLAYGNNQPEDDAYPGLNNMFFRTLTTEGTGYTYNARPFLDIYRKDNPFTEMFIKVMAPQPEKFVTGRYNIYHAYKSGPETTLKVLVQHSEYKDDFQDITSNIRGTISRHR